MSARVTDKTVSHWLIWARNFGEIVSYNSGRGPYKYAKKGESRRWRVRVTPGVTADGAPFKPSDGSIFGLLDHGPEDVVPTEMMLTGREALLFGMGCACGRASALAGREEDWQHERAWPERERAAFAQRRAEARTANREDAERDAREWEEERQQRMEEYRRQKQEPPEPRVLENPRALEPGDE